VQATTVRQLVTQLATLVARASGWFGSSIAVEDAERTVSFNDVEVRSNRFANALLTLAPTHGDRVALLIPNRLELVEIDLAIIKAGRVKVPINTRLKHEERAHVINDSGAAVLVFDASEEQAVADMLGELVHPVVLIRVGEGRLGSSYDEVMGAGSPMPARSSAGPDDPSLILYTSGTTGRPKGATTTFAGRLAGTINMLANEIEPRPGDAMAHVGSMAHGSGSKVLAHYLRGSRNIPIVKWDPKGFLESVERHRITHSFMVPTMIESMVEAAPGSTADWSTLRAVSYGGAPIAPSRLAKALDVMGHRFVQVYGSCEAPHPVLVLASGDHEDVGSRLASAGRETLGFETRVVNTDGESVADGEAGELLVSGPSLMAGYWNQPAATAEVLRDGWYHTGDVVRRDEGGYVHIVDRARDVIITGGYNVYPAELEAVLARHPGVAEVAVVGIPDDHWGEAVKAIVVPNGQVDVESILEHCSRLLASYKRPRSVDLVSRLPRGSTGKVLRREIRDSYWEGRDRRV
jgi:acyl-CoA synthetase (AMP-forming)/AMP-acid ligase II